MLRIYPVTLSIAGEVARVIPLIARADPDLARQLRRAVASVPLNVAAGAYSRGRLRQADTIRRWGRAGRCSRVSRSRAMRCLEAVPQELEPQLGRVIGTLGGGSGVVPSRRPWIARATDFCGTGGVRGAPGSRVA